MSQKKRRLTREQIEAIERAESFKRTVELFREVVQWLRPPERYGNDLSVPGVPKEIPPYSDRVLREWRKRRNRRNPTL